MRQHVVVGLLGVTLMAEGAPWPTTEVSYVGNIWLSLATIRSIQTLSNYQVEGEWYETAGFPFRMVHDRVLGQPWTQYGPAPGTGHLLD